MKNPIKKNIFANIYGVGINAFNQLALVPFFLIYWGTSKYGDWIVLSAFSYFFNISEAGLNSSTANLFAYAYVTKDYSKCNKLLTNNFVLIFVLLFFVFTGVAFLSFFLDFKYLFNLTTFSELEASVTFFLLLSMIFVGMLSQVFNAIYRANSDTARGVFFDNTAILLEVLVLMLCLLTERSIFVTVSLYALPKFLLFILKIIDTRRLYDYKFMFVKFDCVLMKSVLKSSFSFMYIPIGHILLNQGITVLINSLWGSIALVNFNTMRTLTNFVRKIIGSIASAVWPEMTLAFGNHNYEKVQILHKKTLFYTFILTLFVSVMFLLFGEYIYVYWTQGKIVFSSTLFVCFLVGLLFYNLWFPSSVVLMAANNVRIFGILYILIIVVTLLSIYFVSAYLKLYGVVLMLMVVDVFMLIYTFPKALLLSRDKFSHFFCFK